MEGKNKEGKGGVREEGSETGAGPEGLWVSHNHPVFVPIPCLLGALLLLSPPPEPPGLSKLSCLLVQFYFLTDKREAGSALPFTQTGWLSAAVASVLVRKIMKEVKEATALELQAGERIWAWHLLGRPSQCPTGGAWGAGLARGHLGSPPTSPFLRGECGEQCGLWSRPLG